MRGNKKFFTYVIPSVLAFALSGVYAIVDGYFVGNSVGDVGLSTINIAYPAAALIQAVGTGIGMGGAVSYSISRAENKEGKAREYIAGTLWLLLAASAIITVLLCGFRTPILKALGAEGEILSLGEGYLFVIALGAGLQIIGTGLVPLIRNNGGAEFAMVTMVMGFGTNIVLDYLFVWVCGWSTGGAALATVIGQGVTMAGGLIYLFRKGQIHWRLPAERAGRVMKAIIKVGIAPFGLTLTPNFSLILINRFSVFYGGDEAIAIYACISYVISIVYLILQGVGDGSQPLMSTYYGEGDIKRLRQTRKAAYGFALLLSFVSILALYAARAQVGVLLGASGEVAGKVAGIFPVFLLAVPFIAVSRITTAGFYATGKSALSYILTYIEPIAMLILLLALPPLLGGQIMIWWGTAIAQIITAMLSLILKFVSDKRGAGRKEKQGS